MAMIQVKHLTFGYDGNPDNVFEDVSFQMDTDWKLGFIGRNGRGKTTFLKLLLGEYAYSGHISCPVPVSYFPYPVPDAAWNTLEIAEALAPEAEQWQLSRELSLLQVDQDVLYRPFETLSNGEQTKVLLAVLFLRENRFLLIDEPTNHLDEEARETVCRYLNGKKGFILVSHDRWLLDHCVDHVLSVNRADIEVQAGNFSSWRENRERQDQFERAEQEKLKKEVDRLAKAARRTSDWSDKTEKGKYNTRNSGLRPDRGYIGHKAAKMMQRSKTIDLRRETAVEEKAKLLKNLETAERLVLRPMEYPKRVLAEANGLSAFYGEKCVFSNARFTIERGDRIAVCGRNGCGKSTLLKLLLGEPVTHTGELQIGGNLVCSYVQQQTDGLKGDLRAYAEQNGLDESLFKAILRKLDFSRQQFEKDMAGYSDGQKKKVLLARSLCQPAHLYVWDEPLNFIDVLSRMQMEELILDSGPTLLFVEHDRAFRERIATKFLVL
ncbi:ribosomal protection-like ABC-F family protein [Anaeromassilibacillus senegalensis]|uniref:ribosomal protection-like ABC-F family protein n=1 Tax=Anaeromassilibacillus senegalensis TaxID=1673717 RepID=UPI0006808205|nr:ABC-F type ribosomal protection protein [Anaeromassilibacillus senegalensis]